MSEAGSGLDSCIQVEPTIAVITQYAFFLRQSMTKPFLILIANLTCEIDAITVDLMFFRAVSCWIYLRECLDGERMKARVWMRAQCIVSSQHTAAMLGSTSE